MTGRRVCRHGEKKRTSGASTSGSTRLSYGELEMHAFMDDRLSKAQSSLPLARGNRGKNRQWHARVAVTDVIINPGRLQNV